MMRFQVLSISHLCLERPSAILLPDNLPCRIGRAPDRGGAQEVVSDVSGLTLPRMVKAQYRHVEIACEGAHGFKSLQHGSVLVSVLDINRKKDWINHDQPDILPRLQHGAKLF